MKLKNRSANESGRRSNRTQKRWSSYLCCAALLLSVGFVVSGCHFEKDEDASGGGSKTPAAGSIDPKSLANGGPTTQFYIDLVNTKPYKTGTVLPVKADSGEITVNGWGADYKNKKAAAGVFLTIDDKTDIAASYGEERKDVATFFKDNNYANTGFTVKAPTASLAKGKHTLTFKVVSADKKEYFVPEQKIEIDLQ